MNEEKMKVYFIAPISGRDNYSKYHKRIISILEKQGLEVIDPVSDLTKSELEEFSKSEFRDYQARAQNAIKDADFFVAECSVSAATVGYEIGFAIFNSKPTLVLRHEKEGSLGHPFSGNSSKLLTLADYNEKTLEKKIKSFLRKAEKGIFVKRLPIEFTQNQVDYVEYRQSDTPKRKSFNAAVRQIIDETSEKDKKYQEILD